MILRAAWVVPVTSPPIRDGYVAVHGREIAAVGAAADLPAGAAITDLRSAILTPGLVNAHTHLELTCYAGKIPPAPFWSWLPKLVKLRAAPGQVDRERQGVVDGAWESLRGGVTCVGDISRLNLHWPVLQKLPIRKVCFVELLSLADQPPRNVAELRAGVDEVREGPLLTVGVTPHAPYSVPGEQIAASLQLATQRRRPWCTHWAESAEECGFLRDGTPFHPFLQSLLTQCGIRSPHRSPIEYLERCASGCSPGLLAHFNYAAPGDAERLAAAGHSVAYCPRAHRFFGHPPHPYRRFLEAGVRVVLGTDSSAGNENLALLEETQFLRRHTPDAPPADRLLRMITLDAAAALGLDRIIGSLEAGKAADLAAFPCPAQVSDPVCHLIEEAPRPTRVWVAGGEVLWPECYEPRF